MGVGAGLYMCDVVVKNSRSLSHILMSSFALCCPTSWILKNRILMAHRLQNVKMGNRATDGQRIIEISQFFEFQDGSRPSSWILKNQNFNGRQRYMMVNMRHRAKYRGDWSNSF